MAEATREKQLTLLALLAAVSLVVLACLRVSWLLKTIGMGGCGRIVFIELVGSIVKLHRSSV